MKATSNNAIATEGDNGDAVYNTNGINTVVDIKHK